MDSPSTLVKVGDYRVESDPCVITIRPATDRVPLNSPLKRPRQKDVGRGEWVPKRQRVQDIPPYRRSAALHVIPSGFMPDSVYYYPTGDLKLFIKDIVLKVHSDRVARPGSELEARLKHRHEPGGEHVPMSYTFADFTPMQFRHFLWNFYSLPFDPPLFQELVYQKIDRLLDSSHIAHKLRYPDIGKWALNTITSLFEQIDTSEFLKQGIPRLRRVMKHAETNKHDDLKSVIVRQWLCVLRNDEKDAKQILDFAESYSLPELRGQAYYNLLKKGQNAWDDLPPACRTVLLSAFVRLIVLWEEMKARLLALDNDLILCFQCPPGASSQFWRSLLLKDDPGLMYDIVGRMKNLLGELETWKDLPTPPMCEACFENAKYVIKGHLNEVEDSLSERFK